MVCACWQWRTFGFLQFPRLFAPDEIGWITEEFEKVVPGGDNNMESEAAAAIHGKENVRPEHCLRCVGGVLAPGLRVVGGADGEVRRELHLDNRADNRPLRAPLRPLPRPTPPHHPARRPAAGAASIAVHQ